MSVRRTIILTAALALASPVGAQTCSGGADGGMDATGNQCGSYGGTPLVGGAASLPRTVDARALQTTATAEKIVARSALRTARAAQADRPTLAPARTTRTSAVAASVQVLATDAVPR